MASHVDSKHMKQYRYCTVCRRHHDRGRKHIFTKHHKEKLAGTLANLLKKVRNKHDKLTIIRLTKFLMFLLYCIVTCAQLISLLR